jgi:hypothetical protein
MDLNGQLIQIHSILVQVTSPLMGCLLLGKRSMEYVTIDRCERLYQADFSN